MLHFNLHKKWLTNPNNIKWLLPSVESLNLTQNTRCQTNYEMLRTVDDCTHTTVLYPAKGDVHEEPCYKQQGYVQDTHGSFGVSLIKVI